MEPFRFYVALLHLYTYTYIPVHLLLKPPGLGVQVVCAGSAN